MNSTDSKQKLTRAWRLWVTEEIKRRSSLHSIIAFMLKNGFNPTYAMNTVQIIKDELDSECDYIYETPRLSQHCYSYIKTTDRKIYIRVIIEKPFVAVLDNVLTQDECNQLIELSKGRLKHSRTANPVTGEFYINSIRTSYGYTFKWDENELITRLQLRFSELMNLPSNHAERLQILRYEPNQEYKPHFDYFPENKHGLDMSGQRVSTLVVYLNDVDEGGATIFPSIGLSVRPKIGSAVYFEYLNSQSQLDTLTLHAGAPVIKGEKWVVTQWMRQKEQR